MFNILVNFYVFINAGPLWLPAFFFNFLLFMESFSFFSLLLRKVFFN